MTRQEARKKLSENLPKNAEVTNLHYGSKPSGNVWTLEYMTNGIKQITSFIDKPAAKAVKAEKIAKTAK